MSAPRRLPSSTLTVGANTDPFWSRPDPSLAAAGVEGEYVVARVRLLAMALLLIAPTWNLIFHRDQAMHIAGFGVTFAAALASYGIWLRLARGEWKPWIGFASSTFDVSMVSLALLSFYVYATPLHALNSNVTFEMYFLALVATSLRYDARICLVVGALAIAQYSLLWLTAATTTDLAVLAERAGAGPYIPVDLATRLILLTLTTLLALTLVRRAQRLLYLAARDRLTGLYNRGHFDRTFLAAFDQSQRDGTPLAIALIDVDHFKRVNDVHGHSVGDSVLQQIADVLVSSMRRTDIVARYGGEEFVIVMPNTAREAAKARIEALRLDLLQTPIILPSGEELHISCSAGVAGTPSEFGIEDSKVLIDIADRRLLAAKRAGRARVYGADVIEHEPVPNA